MRSDRDRQRGFTLVEVMVAALLLSVLAIGMTSLWTITSAQSGQMVTRQKAVFVLNGEMERLSALYQLTGFGESSAKQSQFPPSPNLPETRWIYGESLLASLLTLIGSPSGDNFVTTRIEDFVANDWLVWEAAGATLGQERNYVWLDRGRRQMARLSWLREIVRGVCPPGNGGGECYNSTEPLRCLHFSGSGTGDCELITLILEFPYRLEQPDIVVPPDRRQVMTLRTIVGRRR